MGEGGEGSGQPLPIDTPEGWRGRRSRLPPLCCVDQNTFPGLESQQPATVWKLSGSFDQSRSSVLQPITRSSKMEDGKGWLMS